MSYNNLALDIETYIENSMHVATVYAKILKSNIVLEETRKQIQKIVATAT